MPGTAQLSKAFRNLAGVGVILSKGLVIKAQYFIAVKLSTEDILRIVVGSPIAVVGVKVVLLLFDGLGRRFAISLSARVVEAQSDQQPPKCNHGSFHVWVDKDT